ncbi:MAG: flagellar basal body P-ring protein FlgI [Candidatus Saganbacteria bacterium]|nr:flagellar basal body P-ring protein FlgI [Candidatus Saganbacteria bacterium]
MIKQIQNQKSKIKIKELLLITLLGFGILSLGFPAQAVAPTVRIKDIAHVLEARENQLMGFGLVVGLKGTGDTSQTGFTMQALTNLLSKMGVVPQGVDFKSKNVAAVIVTTDLPPFVKKGQPLDVVVSAVGDANSLMGGTLLVTTLQGVDDQVYAVAQGPVSVASLGDKPEITPYKKRQMNTGKIPGGALVEKEVPVSLGGQGQLTIVLDQPDFTTANRMAESIRKINIEAVAKDPASVVIPFYEGENAVELVAKVENLQVVPDMIAKIIIDEKTGTVVMGENVRIAPVAVTYGELDIKVGPVDYYSEGGNLYGSLSSEKGDYITSRTTADIATPKKQIVMLGGNASLGELVRVLNTLGAGPQDLIAIIQAMKKAGAILAEVEVI